MCVFCRIVAGELPATVVSQNDDFMAFKDIDPVAPVHILVIPKRHIENFHQIDGETMGKMSAFIQEVARKAGVDQSGYRLVTNCGKQAGQEVMHLHFHLLGGGKIVWKHKKAKR